LNGAVLVRTISNDTLYNQVRFLVQEMHERKVLMNIIFLCLGTRGDVQPYVAIGKAAKAKGHFVAVCTGETFQGFVEENGLEFIRCSLDLMAVLKTPEGKQVFEEGMKHPVKAMKFARKVINPLYRKSMTDFYNACKGRDIIVYHPKAFGAVDIVEKLGIACVSMPLVPIIYPIAAFPNLAITTKNLGSGLNKLTYKAANAGAESSNIKDINEFRETELHLEKRKAGTYMIWRNKEPLPMIYPISDSLFPGVLEFKNNVFLSGFPVLEDAATIDQETEEFLAKGAAPVVITFSSMPLKSPQVFMEKITKALRESGNRGILIVGNSGMQMKSDDTILLREFLPHDELFKKAKGILHHGGVGTMAAALRSGKPQVIMPFNVDQPFWAKRLYDLAFALKPINETDPTEVFIDRFYEMEKEACKNRAKEIAAILEMENANEKAVQYLEEQVKAWKNR